MNGNIYIHCRHGKCKCIFIVHIGEQLYLLSICIRYIDGRNLITCLCRNASSSYITSVCKFYCFIQDISGWSILFKCDRLFFEEHLKVCHAADIHRACIIFFICIHSSYIYKISDCPVSSGYCYILVYNKFRITAFLVIRTIDRPAFKCLFVRIFRICRIHYLSKSCTLFQYDIFNNRIAFIINKGYFAHPFCI